MVPAMVFPCQEEKDDTAVGRGGIKQSHCAGAVVSREDDMNASRRCDDVLALLVIHLANGVGKGACTVDYALGADSDIIGWLPITFGDHVLDFGSADAAVVVLDEARHFGVVQDGSAVEGGSDGDGDVHTRVVMGTVIVDQGANEVSLLEHGKSIESLAPSEEVGAFNAFAASEEVVELCTGPVVRAFHQRLRGSMMGSHMLK